MFWIFKDLVAVMKESLLSIQSNSGLAQFDHAQSNSIKWPKG